MPRTTLALVLAVASFTARAQTSPPSQQPYPPAPQPYPPAQQPAYPPAQPPPSAQQPPPSPQQPQQPPSAQQPAAQPPAQPPPPAQGTVQGSGTGSTGQGSPSTAQPGAPSQQVIVNPPQQPPPPAPSATPPPATTVVNPPPNEQTTVVEQSSDRNPLKTVAMDALYGGGAGLLVGAGFALAQQDHWQRNLAVGTGVGLIVGAAVGGIQAARQFRERTIAYGDRRPASDGMNRTDVDPVITARTVALGFHF